jgi:hypothetical protein
LYGLASSKSKAKPINLEGRDYYEPSPTVKKAFIDTDNADVMLRLDKTIKRPTSFTWK